MFDSATDVFENVPAHHRPDMSQPSPEPVTTGMHGAPSPDGLGMSMQGEIPFLEPPDASPQAALRTAGITSLVAAVAFGGGLALGGPWGGMSGIMLSGSAFNVYRAQKWWGSADASEKSEAVVSALFGAIGVIAGGYAGYRAYQAKQ